MKERRRMEFVAEEVGDILKEHEKWPVIKYLLDMVADFVYAISRGHFLPDIGSFGGRIERAKKIGSKGLDEVRKQGWVEQVENQNTNAPLPCM